MKKFYYLLFIFTCIAARPQAQFTITPNANAAQLVQTLAGSGVTISNPTVNCEATALGTFNNGNLTTLGLNQGVILTTGSSSLVNAAATTLVSTGLGNAGDANLTTLINNFNTTPGVTLATSDACILEFDIIPNGDTVRFDYVFGSEEYTSYVCTQYTDVFGFFVTGPNPLGGNYTNQNIALVPNTNIPVAINSVNGGNSSGTNTPCILNNTQYYVNNNGLNIAYDGFTTVLTAKVAVNPCVSYHLKLAIADVGSSLAPDDILDSGVFLEAKSFTSTNTTISASSAFGGGFTNAVEGCANGIFRFVINPVLTTPYTINYAVGGTATNGTDYTTITNSLTIPAGDSLGTITINALNDGLNEGNESVKIYLLNPCNNQPYDSATLFIQDTLTCIATASDYNICQGESTTLTGLGGVSYSWTPAGTLSSPNAQITTATPAVTTTYQLTTTVGGCQSQTNVTINVSAPGFTVDAGPNDTVCANETVTLQPVVTQGSAPYTYSWTPNQYMSAGANTTLNPNVTPLQTTTYRLTVNSANGCSLQDSVRIFVSGVGPQVTATANPTLICPGDLVNLNFTSSPVNCGVNLIGAFGNDDVDSLCASCLTQTGSPTSNVTLYGNFVKSRRIQMLYTAAELAPLFNNSGGTIKELSWRVGTYNSNASLQNYTIRIKCVSPAVTSLTNWESGMKTVYGPKTYTPVTGANWNNHFLDSLYDWDGVSNLVIEVCFFNAVTSGNFNNMMQYSNVPGSVLYSSGATDQCSGTVPTTFAQRPKLKMRLNQPNYNNFVINWTPNTGPNAVSNAAIRNPTANPQSTQVYQVSVSQNGCAGSNFVTVSVDTTVKVNAGPDLSFCTGNAIPLQAVSSGSPAPGNSFQYEWRVLPANNVIGNTANITVSPSGTTSYVVRMTGGPCPVFDTVSVSIGALGITPQVTPISCNGAANGKIKVVPAGTAPYSFTWSANAATGNIDSAVNLSPGTYIVTVTDALNCVGSDTVVLTQPTAITFTNVIKPVSCFGGNNGEIGIVPSGGSGGFSFVWNNGAPNNDTAFALVAGAYQLTITDINNCSATGTFTVNQPTQLSIASAPFKNVRCFGGNDGWITVNPAGGTSPYTYSWTGGLATQTISSLVANTYNVTVYDNNLCSVTASYTITQPAAGITFGNSSVTDASCFGAADGSGTVNPAGGATPYTYLWTPSAQTTQTATGLSAQIYTVLVTDDSLCTASTAVTISQPQQILLAGVVTDVNCFGVSDGAIDLTVTNGTGGLNYLWSPNGETTQDLLNIIAGPYDVVVTDANNCTATQSFTVTEPAQLVLNAPTLTNVSCFGGNNGSITANPSGGVSPYQYTWNPSGNSQNISQLVAGLYSVTVEDANNCSVLDAYTITGPTAALTITGASIIDVLCNGAATGAIDIAIAGGTTPYNYAWSSGQTSEDLNAVIAGGYDVLVTDANSCTVTDSYIITQPTAITFGAPVITDVSCNGGSNGSAEVTPVGGAGGFTYTWNGVSGPNPFNNISANTYVVVVTDNNSCTASTSLTVNEPAALVLNPQVSNALCFQSPTGQIDANPSGGNTPYSFLWSDASAQTTQTAYSLLTGNYIVTVTDATGCSASASSFVDEPTKLTFTMATTQVTCPGEQDGSITVVASGATPPYSYSATQDGANFYYTTTTSIIGLASGYYIVIVSDDNGCTDVDTAFVPAPVPDVFVLTTDSTSCYGPNYNDGQIRVEGQTINNMPYQYSVDGSGLQFSGDFFNQSAGNHTVLAVNNFGCETELSAIVPEPAEGIADISPEDTTLQLGDVIQLFSSFGPYPNSTIVSYAWTPADGLSCMDCPNPVVNNYAPQTEYTLTITYNDICVASSAVTVLVNNDLPIYVPNAFTPNGDGNNDVFFIYGEGIKTVDLKIFNRWGIKVFDSNNQYYGWDGTYKAVLQNPAVFTYQATITFLDNKEMVKVGSLTLVK
jgi:gliding motility-associated-like protein